MSYTYKIQTYKCRVKAELCKLYYRHENIIVLNVETTKILQILGHNHVLLKNNSVLTLYSNLSFHLRLILLSDSKSSIVKHIKALNEMNCVPAVIFWKY